MEYKYRFTVIIPIYNAEAFLEEAIQSVIEQDIGFREHIQMILVNDGSPDDSERICLKYRDLYPENVIYLRQENAGVSAARNAGIPYIQGKYVNFLDSDDKWAPDAFSHISSFFEENGKKVDVACCRMQFFEARKVYHMLDYKFTEKKPYRVVNIVRSYRDLHVHITSSVLRTESLGDLRFDPQLKYGEDTTFLTKMILKKRKYGALYYANHFYRKRLDNSSAVQGQTQSPDWYFVSPKRFLEELATYSISLYGSVLPYVQSLLFYDIGYRMKKQLDDALTQAQKEDYIETLRSLLQRYVSDLNILTSRQYKREIQILALRLKYGEAFEDHIVFADASIFFDSYPLTRFDSDKSLLKVHFMDIRNNKFHLEGTVRKWVLELIGDSAALQFQSLKVTKKRASWSKLPDRSITTLFGPIQEYATFHVTLPLDGSDTHYIKAVLKFRKVYAYKLRLTFGRFSPISHELPDVTYRFFGKYLVELEPPYLKITVPQNRTLSLLRHEWAFERQLRRLGVGYLNPIRRRAMLVKKFHKKKIWLVSDRTEVAGDNGEAFFKYLVKHCGPNVDPYFVINRDSKDFKRMQQYGKVIPFHAKKNLVYTLAASHVISSAGNECVFNPFTEDRLYMKDMLRAKFTFLQHGIIKDDLSDWLNSGVRVHFDRQLWLYKAPSDPIRSGPVRYTAGNIENHSQAETTAHPAHLAQKHPEARPC